MTLAQIVKKSGLERREAEDLLGCVLKKDRAFVMAHVQDELKPKEAIKFLDLCARRLKGEPFAYLVGFQPFLGCDFLVDKNTLIPRPETEGLAERAIERAKLAHQVRSKAVIVDVGTGSGCIAISAALACPFATVIASDVSDGALRVARKNAKRLDAKITFVKDDLLGRKVGRHIFGSRRHASDVRRQTSGLIIVSNPPYLPSSDKKTMPRDVVKYEPSKALFAGPDGTRLIVKLLKQIKSIPTSCSMTSDIRPSALLEIDPSQSDKLKKLATELFPDKIVKIEPDLCGRERYLIIV